MTPTFKTMIRTNVARPRVLLLPCAHSPSFLDLLASCPPARLDSRLFRLRCRQYGPFLLFFGEVVWFPSFFWGTELSGVFWLSSDPPGTERVGVSVIPPARCSLAGTVF